MVRLPGRGAGRGYPSNSRCVYSGMGRSPFSATALGYPPRIVTAPRDYIHYSETWTVVRDLADEGHDLKVEDDGRGLGGPGVRLRLPLVLQDLPVGASFDEVLAALDAPMGRQLVVLIQAGSTALGLWDDGELVAHKVIKTYVVRGRGKAQPKHLETRGKSRYGSRLRLQNYRRQIEGTAARLERWHREHGPFARVFLSCPTRARADFLPGLEPHLGAAGDPVRIPYDVRRPGYAELLRIRSRLEHGWVERLPPAG